MNINNFDFSLPKSLIAQEAKTNRSESRLLVINRKTKQLIDENFKNIDNFFSKKDLFVVNDTKVIPARLHGNRQGTKGKVEIFVERILTEKNFICQLIHI